MTPESVRFLALIVLLIAILGLAGWLSNFFDRMFP